MLNVFKRPKACVVFSAEYLVGVTTYGLHQSFDIFKYKRIRDLLISEKLLKASNIFHPRPCSFDEIRLVHPEKFIHQIKDPILVNQILKIEINSLWENKVLEYFKAVSGGTIKAAFKAVKLKKPLFNLGGGFHHSQPDKAEGFCLINDIAIAIKKMRLREITKKVLIIDLDYHQGNGNAIIFKEDPTVFTLSVHADHWIDIESQTNHDVLISSDISDEDYLQTINKSLEEVLQIFNPQMIFYVAGSDPYEKDSLADMKISRECMLKRNMLVLSRAKELDIPIVILPGGGYGSDSWEVYYDFLKEALKG